MTYINFTPPTQYGWVCPKCGRANAPMMMTCPCWMNTVGVQNDTTCKHQWYTDTAGTRCGLCGATPYAGGTDA